MKKVRVILFKDIIRKLIGKADEYSLEHRFFTAACFVGGTSGLLASIINLIFSIEPVLTVITICVAVVYYMFYFISIKKKIYKFMVMPYILISIAAIGYIWFLNAGSNGPVSYVLVTGFLVYMVITKGALRTAVVILFTIAISVLFILEYKNPELIINYSNSESKFYDLYLTALFCSGLIAFIVSFIMANYQEEREKVISQRDMIQEQNMEIIQAEKKLRKSKDFTESIISSAQDGIIVLDLNYNFLQVNKAFLNLTGYPKSTLLKMNIRDLIFCPPDLSNLSAEKFHFPKSGSQSDCVLTNSDGDSIPVSISVALLKDGSGRAESLMAIIKDITEYKNILKELTLHKEHFEELVDRRTKELAKTNTMLKASKEKAEASDRLKSAFLSNMSHEIRTPMNAILGFSQLMRDPGLSKETSDNYLDIISLKGNLLLNIINDIIDISKVEAGEMEISKSPVNVNEILDELYSTYIKLKDSQKKSHIDLRVIKQEPADGCIIFTDPFRLKQVLSNLLDNAIKFTNQGFIHIGYSITGSKSDKKIKFYVKDSGIGILNENIDIIFNRFRQVDESHTREFGGTGLGLTISRKLVELMGGKLDVESQFGQGSTFYFTVPCEPIPPKHKSVSKYTGPKNINNWQEKTILIVEDNNSSFLLLKYYLEHTGARILHTISGKEAIEICKSNPEISIVLMDIQLPDLSGYETTTLIKKHRNDLPVIAQTAHALTEDFYKSKNAGCDDYIAKPYGKDKLLSILNEYLN
ncbi:MAG: response regulator [Bacteroidetes bacterium]|nr:response regulator [Bacteroidota bacterium]